VALYTLRVRLWPPISRNPNPVPVPLEAKPLFRPDVLRTHLANFAVPDRVESFTPKLGHWAELLSSRRADTFKEQEILPDFLTDFFCGVLGYTRPADGHP
jgi:hypothetical protein